MLESRDGTMWMATEGAGLLKYDRGRNRLVRYKNHPEDSESLGSDSVIYLFEDSEGDIWVDLHEAAPYFFSENPPLFQTFTHQRGQLKRLACDRHLRGPEKNSLDWINRRTEPN
jgi:two component regulator with propeller domain